MKQHLAFSFWMYRSRNYRYSFGRNSTNTWHELDFSLKNDIRSKINERDGSQCRYCGKEDEYLELDHIISVRAGGPVCDIGNIQLLCHNCHKKKTLEIDSKYITAFVLPSKHGRHTRRINRRRTASKV